MALGGRMTSGQRRPSQPIVMVHTGPLIAHADLWHSLRSHHLTLIGTGHVSSEGGTVLTAAPIDNESPLPQTLLDTLHGPHDDVQQP